MVYTYCFYQLKVSKDVFIYKYVSRVLSETMKKISVIITTYNRPEKVLKTIRCVSDQNIPIEDYEIIVVDNGSKKPVKLPDNLRQTDCRIVRFETNQERCRSRTAGAEEAKAELILFSDDDLIFKPNFVEEHLKAHQEWAHIDKFIAIGRQILPPEHLSEPGVAFRQKLEFSGMPTGRELVKQPNFATAANMSIRRELYLSLGGFDDAMIGIEDQDLAMRHTADGGKIAYLPEAFGIHDDDGLDFLSFCKRQEFAAQATVLLTQRYPDWQDSKERNAIIGNLNLGKEPISVSLKKIMRSMLASNVGKSFLSLIIGITEKIAPQSGLLNQLYRFTLGVYLQKGYRRGLEKFNLETN